jgi:hypothetical protein
MELRQLTYFVAIAEERSFIRAAERIPIAQPAISQQIRRLEAELGERLFICDRRGITLTPAGLCCPPGNSSTGGVPQNRPQSRTPSWDRNPTTPRPAAETTQAQQAS